MFRSTISTTDAATGAALDVPADVLKRVERANEMLEAELADLTGVFPTQAEWQFGKPSDGTLRLDLSLTTDRAGVYRAAIPMDVLASDVSILRHLRRTLLHFARVLWNVVSDDFDRMRKQHETWPVLVGA